jgi:plastocyanin
MRALRTTAPAVIAVLLLAACGGGGQEAGTGGAAGGAGAADTLVMQDNVFEPSEWQIQAGGGSFTVSNEGQALHNLTIEDAGIDQDVQAGQEATVDIELEAGEYEFICKYHEAQGMTGTLVVQ